MISKRSYVCFLGLGLLVACGGSASTGVPGAGVYQDSASNGDQSPFGSGVPTANPNQRPTSADAQVASVAASTPPSGGNNGNNGGGGSGTTGASCTSADCSTCTDCQSGCTCVGLAPADCTSICASQ
ncbi:MAG TPA: hypothetical protein VHV51_07100 [Polyangiaceae bacterium]|nr:hypothetical protein [Polyangiaceae bacterium]